MIKVKNKSISFFFPNILNINKLLCSKAHAAIWELLWFIDQTWSKLIGWNAEIEQLWWTGYMKRWGWERRIEARHSYVTNTSIEWLDVNEAKDIFVLNDEIVSSIVDIHSRNSIDRWFEEALMLAWWCQLMNSPKSRLTNLFPFGCDGFELVFQKRFSHLEEFHHDMDVHTKSEEYEPSTRVIPTNSGEKKSEWI